MTIENNINKYYEEQIENIADAVMERIGESMPLDDIITEETDSASYYYCDQAYYLAKYHTTNCANANGSIDWLDVWQMVYDDVRIAVEKRKKEKKN